jgi:hypothetical protein
MQCPNCGQENEQAGKFCPNCGATLMAEPVQPEEKPTVVIREAYVRPDYNPARDGRPAAEAPQAASAQPEAPGYDAATSKPAAAQVQRPSSTGTIVFSIINMLCCGLGVSLILGVIALIFGIISGSEPTAEDSRRKLKTAMVLNLIGLVFIIIQVIVAVLFVVGVFFLADRNIGSFGNFGHFFD